MPHRLLRPLGLAAGLSLLAALPAPAQPRGQSPAAARQNPQQDTASRSGPADRAIGGLRFRAIGPALTSGRIGDIAVHPRDRNTWYVAVASGGVWKTTNAGTTWQPIFDGQGSYSIGTVVLDPNNPHVVWVGTGENNAQRSVSYGDGVYKSVDGGRTWEHVGLRESAHIGKILVHPTNSDIVYVAAQGPLWSKGGDGGLYRTTDGGKSWTKLLDGGDWSGVTDVVMDPRNPNVMLAATWQRTRRQWGYIAGGPESGLWRSTDGGATWTRAQRGLPGEDLGRIGLAFAPTDGDVAYAIVEAAQGRGGFYRSRDNGVTWERMSAHNAIGLYYQEITVDPRNPDRIYSMDVSTQVSEDGGRTFRTLGERNKHVDNHAIWIDPADTDHLLIGSDGGLYETWDRGQTYKFFANLPVTQFYKVEIDSTRPFYRIYGGTQDNMSMGGPSRTRSTAGIVNSDWFITAGGDGFQTRVHPVNTNIVYSQSQHGELRRFNLETGESVNIQPQVEPGEDAARWHWDSPLIVSPHAPDRIYFASQRIYRSDDRGTTWRPVSGDLSRGIDRNRLPLMERVWGIDAVAKNASTSFYGAVVALAESPRREGLLWAGTDDGLVHVSEDGGQSWRRIASFPGVPDTTFVSDIIPSQHDPSTVYVSFDNHKAGDFKPYLLKSTDLGRTWTAIASNLPERGTVYAVAEDHVDRNLLFAGTEFGVFVTRDGGARWTRMRNGIPTIQVRDMAIHPGENDLVVATFGRGFYVLDDYSPLRQLTPQLLAREGALLPIPRTPQFVLASPLGGGGVGFQGASFYAAPNPPNGAVITYWLSRELQTRRARRQAAERAAARRGEPVFYPPWDSLRVEEREEAPAIILTVTDADGRLVRRLSGPTSAGLHRVTWDLRYAGTTPVTGGGPQRDDDDDDAGSGGGGRGFGGGAGPFVAPGVYTVALARRIDGVVTPLGEPQRVEVYPLDSAARRTPETVAFQTQVARLQRAVLGANALANETMGRVQALKRALEGGPVADARLEADVRAVERRLRELQEAMSGDPTIGRRNEPTPPSLLGRLGRITGGAWSGTLETPTTTQRRQYEIVAAEFGGVLERLRAVIETDLRRLEEGAEAAGVPWTSGRVPVWKP